MEKAWFQMRDQIRRKVADAAWIPLTLWTESKAGEYGHVGYQSDLYGVHTLGVPIADRVEGERVSWSDNRDIHVWVQDGVYKPADAYPLRAGGGFGLELVLRQQFDGALPSTLHLNQDLVIALRLWREGDAWLRPSEGFEEVARLMRDSQGREIGITIRGEHLKDYLAARSMALRVCTYRSRTAVLKDVNQVGWSEDPFVEEVFGGRFEGRSAAIHEGGFPFDAETGVFHMSRTDVDTDAEVPVMERLTGEGAKTDQWSFKRDGQKLFRVEGEFWRDEWIEPASKSPRVNGDHIPSETTFIINGAGDRAPADELKDEDVGKWLWFRPEIVNTVLARRGGGMGWYTRDTGGIEMSAGGNVHFGLNDRGLLNAYAYDIARLDEWERRIWAGFNVSPDGGVSQELTASQVYAEPARTKAPEAFLAKGLDALDNAFRGRFGRPLISNHPDRQKIISRTHRFRVVDLPGLLALAKDLARLTADSFDVNALKEALGLRKEDRTGSLKALQAIMSSIIGEDRGRELMGPLVGVYDLRVADAHLPSSELEEALKLAQVDQELPFVHQGRDLIHQVVLILVTSAAILNGDAVTPERQARAAAASNTDTE